MERTEGTPAGKAEEGRLLQIQAAMFSGPLPPPEALARYDEIVPNGADHIMAMAERQAANRERLEARVVDGNVRNQTRGAYFAFILALVVVLAGCFLIYRGEDVQGFTAIIGVAATLAGTFVFARSAQRKERQMKEDALQERRSKLAQRQS